MHEPTTLPPGSGKEVAQQQHLQQSRQLCSFLQLSINTSWCLQGPRGSQHSRSAPAGGGQRLKSHQPLPARARRGQRPALLLRRTRPQVGSLMLGLTPQAATGSPVLHQSAAHKVCMDCEL